MLSKVLLPEPLGRLLVSLLLISSLASSLGQFSSDDPQPGSEDLPGTGDGDFQDTLLNYALHQQTPGGDDAVERLAELRALMAVKNSQIPSKRYSNFVRVGRGGTFLRIGKSNDDDFSYGSDGFSEGDQSHLPETADYATKRQMHRFIRIGRDMGGDGADDDVLEEDDSGSFPRFRKSPSSFVRIGKAPNKFVRIGKSPSSFVRIGRAPNSFLRIGKAPNKFLRIGKSPSSFVRIGRVLSDTPNIFNDKRPSSFVRIGRSAPTAKRSSFVRIGKSSSVMDSLEKRPSSFVRIGKSGAHNSFPGDSDLKRASSFVRIGKSSLLDQDSNEIDNTKRPSSFVRIGKSQQQVNSGSTAEDKRAGNFLRIGRITSVTDDKTEDKRGFVRIGKKQDDSTSNTAASPGTGSVAASAESMGDQNPSGDSGPINVASRGSAFVRIGKIPSSAFVRIGKNADVMLEQEPARVFSFNRGSRGGHSSFVRIG